MFSSCLWVFFSVISCLLLVFRTYIVLSPSTQLFTPAMRFQISHSLQENRKSSLTAPQSLLYFLWIFSEYFPNWNGSPYSLLIVCFLKLNSSFRTSHCLLQDIIQNVQISVRVQKTLVNFLLYKKKKNLREGKAIKPQVPFMHTRSLQSCLTLCDPLDCSPPGSSLHGILQARILERVAICMCIKLSLSCF